MSEFARYEPNRPEATIGPWTENLRVRPADLRDSSVLAEILTQREGGGDVVARHNWFKGLVDRPGTLLLVAEVAGKVVAYGHAAHHGGSEGCPPGWYLVGLVVSPPFRRHGIGRLLTTRRLEWITKRTSEAFYFANERNRTTIDLHAELGFKELTRDFAFHMWRFRADEEYFSALTSTQRSNHYIFHPHIRTRRRHVAVRLSSAAWTNPRSNFGRGPGI